MSDDNKTRNHEDKMDQSSSRHQSDLAPFRAIVRQGSEGIVILSREGVINYTNPAAEFLLGRKREELLGEMFGSPLINEKKPTEVNMVSGDDRLRYVEIQMETLQFGAEECLVVRLNDVTDYRLDIQDAQEQVKRRDEFLAMLSHEIRNPLSAIQNATSLLVREGLPRESRRQTAEILNRQFTHLGRLLEDMLDLTRISQGKLELIREPTDLSIVLKDSRISVRNDAEQAQHTLRFSLPEEQLYVQGDATRLEQVFVNLLTNAIKFTPQGGEICLEAQIQDEEVVVTVSDNGPGISSSLLPYIFDPFVQEKQTLARSQGGLGLGLALVHSFVRYHEGTIQVESSEAGTTFEVRLPLIASGPTSTEKSAGNVHTRVLLIEDNEDARATLKTLLELESFHVLEACDGPTGLSLILEEKPDLALVDIGLPGLDGYSIARSVRATAPEIQTRLIALTGYGMPQDIEKGIQAGFVAHLIKPVSFESLQELFSQLIEIPVKCQVGAE